MQIFFYCQHPNISEAFKLGYPETRSYIHLFKSARFEPHMFTNTRTRSCVLVVEHHMQRGIKHLTRANYKMPHGVEVLVKWHT